MHEIRSTILSNDGHRSPVASKGKAKSEPFGGLTRIAIKREETRITNQRLEDRHLGLVEKATIVFRRRKREVDVVNVSSRGAMLETDIEPRIGEGLEILFTSEAKTRCAVRWIRGRRIGVEFVNETIFWEAGTGSPVFRYAPHAANETAADEAEPTHDAAEHQLAERQPVDRSPRQRLLRSGTLYWGGVSIPVRLRNISTGGARIDAQRPLAPGAEVELDLGDNGFQLAEVRWSKEGQIGLRFAAEFDLDSLAPAQEAGSVELPEVLKPAYLETEMQPDSPWAARFERLSVTQLKLVDD
jgi:hypothetical protein